MERARAPRPATVEEYLARLPPPTRSLLERLRRTIRSAAPGAEEVIRYGMPAFRQHGTLVYFAAFANHCGFFPGSLAVRRTFAAETRPFAAGKGTLRFTRDRPLPAGLVRRIVKARLAENRARFARRPLPRGGPRRSR